MLLAKAAGLWGTIKKNPSEIPNIVTIHDHQCGGDVILVNTLCKCVKIKDKFKWIFSYSITSGWVVNDKAGLAGWAKWAMA